MEALALVNHGRGEVALTDGAGRVFWVGQGAELVGMLAARQMDALHAEALLINREPVALREIVLERAEGPTAECVEVKVASWHDAGWQLARWARTAPEPRGGYDKVDFRVTWADGETYEGRYDLQRDGESGEAVRGFDLALHIRQFLAFQAHQGRGGCPGHFAIHVEPHQWDNAVSSRQFIEKYLPAGAESSRWWCCDKR